MDEDVQDAPFKSSKSSSETTLRTGGITFKTLCPSMKRGPVQSFIQAGV